eukprot:m.205573 g.205573  ORF g.205573 m.205573 type:complete len:1712 (+) comp13749_c0_seq1:37-5172(+)
MDSGLRKSDRSYRKKSFPRSGGRTSEQVTREQKKKRKQQYINNSRLSKYDLVYKFNNDGESCANEQIKRTSSIASVCPRKSILLFDEEELAERKDWLKSLDFSMPLISLEFEQRFGEKRKELLCGIERNREEGDDYEWSEEDLQNAIEELVEDVISFQFASCTSLWNCEENEGNDDVFRSLSKILGRVDALVSRYNSFYRVDLTQLRQESSSSSSSNVVIVEEEEEDSYFIPPKRTESDYYKPMINFDRTKNRLKGPYNYFVESGLSSLPEKKRNAFVLSVNALTSVQNALNLLHDTVEVKNTSRRSSRIYPTWKEIVDLIESSSVINARDLKKGFNSNCTILPGCLTFIIPPSDSRVTGFTVLQDSSLSLLRSLSTSNMSESRDKNDNEEQDDDKEEKPPATTTNNNTSFNDAANGEGEQCGNVSTSSILEMSDNEDTTKIISILSQQAATFLLPSDVSSNIFELRFRRNKSVEVIDGDDDSDEDSSVFVVKDAESHVFSSANMIGHRVALNPKTPTLLSERANSFVFDLPEPFSSSSSFYPSNSNDISGEATSAMTTTTSGTTTTTMSTTTTTNATTNEKTTSTTTTTSSTKFSTTTGEATLRTPPPSSPNMSLLQFESSSEFEKRRVSAYRFPIASEDGDDEGANAHEDAISRWKLMATKYLDTSLQPSNGQFLAQEKRFKSITDCLDKCYVLLKQFVGYTDDIEPLESKGYKDLGNSTPPVPKQKAFNDEPDEAERVKRLWDSLKYAADNMDLAPFHHVLSYLLHVPLVTLKFMVEECLPQFEQMLETKTAYYLQHPLSRFTSYLLKMFEIKEKYNILSKNLESMLVYVWGTHPSTSLLESRPNVSKFYSLMDGFLTGFWVLMNKATDLGRKLQLKDKELQLRYYKQKRMKDLMEDVVFKEWKLAFAILKVFPGLGGPIMSSCVNSVERVMKTIKNRLNDLKWDIGHGEQGYYGESYDFVDGVSGYDNDDDEDDASSWAVEHDPVLLSSVSQIRATLDGVGHMLHATVNFAKNVVEPSIETREVFCVPEVRSLKEILKNLGFVQVNFQRDGHNYPLYFRYPADNLSEVEEMRALHMHGHVVTKRDSISHIFIEVDNQLRSINKIFNDSDMPTRTSSELGDSDTEYTPSETPRSMQLRNERYERNEFVPMLSVDSRSSFMTRSTSTDVSTAVLTRTNSTEDLNYTPVDSEILQSRLLEEAERTPVAVSILFRKRLSKEQDDIVSSLKEKCSNYVDVPGPIPHRSYENHILTAIGVELATVLSSVKDLAAILKKEYKKSKRFMLINSVVRMLFLFLFECWPVVVEGFPELKKHEDILKIVEMFCGHCISNSAPMSFQQAGRKFMKFALCLDVVRFLSKRDFHNLQNRVQEAISKMNSLRTRKIDKANAVRAPFHRIAPQEEDTMTFYPEEGDDGGRVLKQTVAVVTEEYDQRDYEEGSTYLEPLTLSEVLTARRREVGHGAYGRVRVGRVKHSRKEVAVKILLRDDGNSHNSLEWELMAMLKHKNIIEYHGFQVLPKKYHIVMEYCREGTLQKFLNNIGEPLHFLDVQRFGKDLFSALVYLEDVGIAHRDIKPVNILKCGDTLKLCDFGTAMRLSSTVPPKVFGTHGYLPPEFYMLPAESGKVLSKFNRCDVWQVGCVLLKMHQLDRFPQQPFYITPAQRNDAFIYNYGELEEVHSAFVQFLRRCFVVDINRRPNASVLINDDFFLPLE